MLVISRPATATTVTVRVRARVIADHRDAGRHHRRIRHPAVTAASTCPSNANADRIRPVSRLE
ncbi:hypothetical protein C480_12466 [Natrialba aegyptia DSM 13077]|uniref:Uncharacterized protein n=1 Tax=Natrialba aegyptia DSM 13077 TaxID=1227491 RepID=M0B083_9EURY|nr:hypothetical protein C480_12466 [Natrialba aegyptia DSM 13077]